MAYNIAYFIGKVYKVVGGVETFKGNWKFFVPWDDNFVAHGGNSYSDVDSDYAAVFKALSEANLPSILTYFYIDDLPDNWDQRMGSARAGASKFGHVFSIDDFENSIMRIVIDEHRRIDLNIPSFIRTANKVDCNSIYYEFYYDSTRVVGASFTGPINEYYSQTNSDIRARNLVFPFPNGTYTSEVMTTCHPSWNIYLGRFVNDFSVSTYKVSKNLTNWINGFEPNIYDEGNPYIDGGTSEIGGGGGNFSEESDDVDVDALPTIDAVGTGFATLFTPSKSQLKSLADVMWDSNVFTALQNLVENIQKMFTSLAIVPFEITAGNTVEVTWFGLAITEIYLTLASQQYYEFDMGSIDLKNDSRIFTSGSALDYSPFSSLGIFLPFIGFQELDIDECRDAVINLKYRIDILSGTCVALISLNGNTVYQFTGNCLSQIPITNENMQSLVTDAVQVGIAAAATHSAKGAVGAAESAMEGAEGAKEAKAAKAALGHAEAHLAQTKAGLASATANASMGMKPVYGKAGAISASASLLAVKQPYLFLRTPRQSIPDHYQRYCGFPSNMSGKLSSFSGYTVIEDIRLNGLVATSPEVAEIYQLLKSGVII